MKLPLALAELGLIDRYEFVVQPRQVGHGPTLFAGLSKGVELKLVRANGAELHLDDRVQAVTALRRRCEADDEPGQGRALDRGGRAASHRRGGS